MSRLLHEATTLEALWAAAKRAARGKRRRPEVARFLMDAETECLRLQRALRLPPSDPRSWRPGPLVEFRIRDPKPRTIRVPPFADRVVHHALCAAVEPRLERYAIADSFACRRGKGHHAAVRRVMSFARTGSWAMKADIAAYFASVPHDRLVASLRRRVRDRAMCARIERVIAAGAHPPGSGRGLPIGALTSQYLANLYLGTLDHHVKDDLGAKRYCRYMDDVVSFGDRDEMRSLLGSVRSFVEDVLGLRLNDRATRLVRVRDGVPFLGLRIYPRAVRVRPDRLRRLRQRLRALDARLADGAVTEDDLTASVASHFAHLSAFPTRDLRAGILLRPSGGAGAGRIGLAPGQPRRQLERHPAERALRQPQLECAVQPQREPGAPRPQLSTATPEGPEDRGPRTAVLCPGADQARVQRPAGGLVRGTEEPRPGGGPPR